MRSPKTFLRLIAVFVMVMAAGLVAHAQALPFSVSWQGVKAPIPSGAQWMAECTLNGKIYLFGGLSSSPAETEITLGTTQIYDPSTKSWSSGALMPTARYLATAVAVNGKIYVMGGRTIDSMGSGGPVKVNEIYDPSTDTWSTGASMPAAIRGHAACAYNGKIYVFGGNTGSYQKTVRIYDPSADSWSTGQDMPNKRAYGVAVYVSSVARIYYIGGDNGGSTSSKYYGTAITYDPSSDTWDSGSVSMIDKVSFPGAVFDPTTGKIYIFSGTNWDTANKRDDGVSSVVQVLDTASNTFTQLPNLPPSPISRADSSAGYVDGNIYLIGGGVGFRMVDMYDTTTGTWYQPNPPLAYDSASQTSNYLEMANVVGMNNTLYVLNGYNASGTFAGVYSYDPASNTWSSSTASNPVPRYGAVADVWNGKIAMADGSGNSNLTGDAEVYDPTTDAFTAMATDPTPTVFASGGVVNGKLYVLGGYNGNANVGTARVLDLTANSWTSLANMPSTLDEACGVAYNGKIYIFGGIIDRSTDFLNTHVIIYDPSTNAYSSGATMPAAVYGASAAVYNGYIVVYGGGNLYKQIGTTYYRSAPFLQVYDPVQDQWSSAPGLYERFFAGMAVLGGSLYATGGDDNTYLEDRLDIATLSGGPTPLTATASANPTSGPAPLDVSFTGSASGGTSPYTYDWNFGDNSAHGATASVSHTFDSQGTYSVLFTVTDAVGATATNTLTITVSSAAALSVTASADKTSGDAPLTVNFTAAASGGTSPYTYAWDFGDSSTQGSGADVSHTYSSAGTYAVSVQVTDSTDATANDSHLSITVTAPINPPVISSMKKKGRPIFRIVVLGSNLQKGIAVYINGTFWGDTSNRKRVKWKSTGKIVIKKGHALKAAVPKNTPTTFRFVNPDGGETTLTWQWP